jgi:hypothetical protein
MLPMARNTKQGRDDRADVELDDDLVWGAKNIGEVIRRNTRQTFHLHKTGAIPTKNVGGRIVARRSRLLAIAD